MPSLDSGTPGLHPSFPPGCFAKGLPASALLRLVEPGCSHPMEAHSGAAGLDRGSPPASGSETGTAMSSLRGHVVLDRHTDPWPSLKSPFHALLLSSLLSQFRRPAKSR